MASPTFAEVMAQIVALVKVVDTARTDGVTTVGTHLDSYVQVLEGNAAPSAAQAATRLRQQYASALSDTGRTACFAHLQDLAKAINTDAAAGTDQFWIDLYDYFIDNAQTLETRAITRGAVAAGGSNVGDGTVYRLTTDRGTEPIEASHLTVVTCEIVEDQNTSRDRGRELLSITTGTPGIDTFEEAGSPVVGTLAGLAGDEFIRNASFQSFTGTIAAPTAINNWTSDITVNGTNYDFDDTNYFRISPAERSNSSTPYALTIKASATISQTLFDIGRRINKNVPYILAVRYNRAVNSAAGTLTLHLGSNGATNVVLAAQTGWNTLAIAMDQKCWYENFQEEDLDIKIQWAQTGGTGLIIDDVIFGPMTEFDNVYYSYLGGATHGLRGDLWTFTDTLAGADGKVQSWLWRWFNRYLPSDGTPSIADP